MEARSYSYRFCLGESLNRIFTFLAVSSIFIGGTGFFKTYIGYVLLGEPPGILTCMIVFLVSFSVYSLDKIADLDKDVVNMPQRRSFLYGRKRLVLSCSLAAYALAFILTLLSTPIAIPIVLLPLVANAFYGTKLLPGVPRLKDIPVMKNVVVASIWALITTLMPALSVGCPGAFNIASVLYFMFVKTFVDTVLYDMRDVEGDRLNGVRTIPVMLGTRRTTVLLLAVNSTLLSLLPFMHGDVRLFTAVLIAYGFACILYFMNKRDPLVLDFLVEGEWMLATFFLLVYL
ncbi:MAG TPA: UbiA family prenyltransferase [Methanothrix sp.]|nr:UbiA family prenyltransferase [Methanothrix sp.]HPR67308.1 UbiA family prenyltransferase [Methanothrix sp.]